MIKQASVLAGLFAAIVIVTDVAGPAAAASHVSVRDLQPYYRNETADLSKYNAILLDQLGLDDARVIAPPWYEGEHGSPKKWQLTDSDINWLRKSYGEAMQEQISSDGGYAVVEQPGEGVLIVDIEIIYLMPYARKGEAVTTRGFGEMLVQAQLRDGMTSELLAIYEGTQDVGSEYQQNSRLNNENSLRELFDFWGERVRFIMDKAHGK